MGLFLYYPYIRISSSECIVYHVDESTGGLEISHNCQLSTKDYPGYPGEINNMLWTPDSCALVASWTKGGIVIWSTFGALLMCSLGWDYGLNIDVQKSNPLQILSMVSYHYFGNLRVS